MGNEELPGLGLEVAWLTVDDIRTSKHINRSFTLCRVSQFQITYIRVVTHQDVEYRRLMLPDIRSSITEYFSLIQKGADRINSRAPSPTYRWSPSRPNERDLPWYSLVLDKFHVLDHSDTLGGR